MLFLIGIPSLLVFFVVLLYLFALLKYREKPFYSEKFQVKTSDGWTLPLYHYRPATAVDVKSVVILAHGLSANHRFFDLTGDFRLAAFLSRKNIAVFSVDLRGMGQTKAAKNPGKADTLGIINDVPLIVQEVILHTTEIYGKRLSVFWAGHSLGALLFAESLGIHGELKNLVKGFICISGPLLPPSPDHPALLFRNYFRILTEILPLKHLARLAVFFSGYLQTIYDYFAFSSTVVPVRLLRRLLVNGISDIPSKLVQDLHEWIETGSLTVPGHKRILSSPQSNITIPCLVITGAIDNIAEPWKTAVAFEQIPSRKKKIIILSRIHGYRHDACHTGSILGRNAPSEVYPLINEFIQKNK